MFLSLKFMRIYRIERHYIVQFIIINDKREYAISGVDGCGGGSVKCSKWVRAGERASKRSLAFLRDSRDKKRIPKKSL